MGGYMVKKLLIAVMLIIQTNYLHASKKAIVIGASSGMGRQIAKKLSEHGYIVGLVARRHELLVSLQAELKKQSYIQQIDITDSNARTQLQRFMETVGPIDLIVISISAYSDNLALIKPEDTWQKKEKYLNVDAKGFIALADCALEYFKQQGHGHLVGITSTSGLRGASYNPVYCAAKSCAAYYLEGERNYIKQRGINITISDVIPGYVAVEHSPMGQDKAAYWEIAGDEAGALIVEGIMQKKEIIYVPPKVYWVALLLKYLPDYLYNKFLPWL